MNSVTSLLGTGRTLSLALLLAVPLAAADAPASPHTAKQSTDTMQIGQLLSLVGPDYKKPIVVPDNLFNPFKIEETTELSIQKKTMTVTEQSVSEAVGRRGVSGVVLGSDPSQNRVIIGDQIFSVGDELTFPGDKGDQVPLVAGATVTLREAHQDTLVFDFTAEGESARHTTYSLKSFWRP